MSLCLIRHLKSEQIQMKIENLSDLRVLVQTARTGSLTGAAAALDITPAAASATLKRLETRLGTRLFERSTRAMRLTQAGQTLLDYTTRAFELLDEGEAQVTDDRHALVGRIRVSAPSDLARATLLPWFEQFMQAHPGVHLDLSIGDRTADIVKDELDLAIRYGHLSDSRLVARQLTQSEQVVAAAPSYLARRGVPQTPLDLLEHNCIAFDRAGRPHRTWRFCRDGQWTEVRVRGDRNVDDASIARQWALDGVGIILKSPLEQRADHAQGRLVRLLEDWQTEVYPLHAVLPSGRFVPQRVRALVDFLVEKFRA